MESYIFILYFASISQKSKMMLSWFKKRKHWLASRQQGQRSNTCWWEEPGLEPETLPEVTTSRRRTGAKALIKWCKNILKIILNYFDLLKIWLG